MNLDSKIENLIIPKHIAIIMDGNGRWAKEKGKGRTWGHKEGGKALKNICKAASKLGVKYITVYAFSTENWSRPEAEVNFLMDLLRQYLKDSLKTSKKDNICVRVIGNREGLPHDILKSIMELEKVSLQHTGLNLQIALNYGGRDEICRSIKNIVKDMQEKKADLDEIDEKFIEGYLDTSGIPDPDLMIRTSGETRLSNFLLWQLAYSEFYFTEKFWPDFNKDDLIEAIVFLNKKERRFGGITDEN